MSPVNGTTHFQGGARDCFAGEDGPDAFHCFHILNGSVLSTGITSVSCHSQTTFVQQTFLEHFSVLGLGQDLGDAFRSKKLALT